MKINSALAFATATLAATTVSTAALAHTGIGATAGFAAGFSHPIGGLDHILAMAGVGLFAWMLKGRALWLVPAAFVAVMAAGGVLGVFQVPVPMVELGIALSIVVIGGLVALGKSIPVAAAMAIVGVFAIFHGHAHGTEMPETMSGLSYGIGFMVATALLHGAGIGAGFAIGRIGQARGFQMARVGGAAIAAVGVAIIAGVI
jgi:urease accessory protein